MSWCEPPITHAPASGYVFEHILVAEELIGRFLREG